VQEDTPQDQQEIIEADFKDKKVVSRITVSTDARAIKFIKDQAKFAKEQKVKSALVLTVDESNHVNWNFVGDSELHLALAALSLDDVKEEMKVDIFGLEIED
jgi:hypothetical protein